MEIDLYKLLLDYSELVFFLTLGFGYLIGNTRIGRFKLGAVPGVLLAGLVFGHLGFPPPSPLVQSIGFILFIYSVGVEAGPNFLSVFFQDGFRYLLLALVIAASAFGMTWLLADWLALEPSFAAGLMAGALTSTPTLAAARDTILSGLTDIAPALHEEAIQNIGVAYAITYIFGLIGLLIFIRIIPAFLKTDLVSESRKLATQHHIVMDEEDESISDRYPIPIIRAYEVQDSDYTGKPVGHAAFQAKTGCIVQKLKRDNLLLDITEETTLEAGDRISAIGPPESHKKMKELLGQPILDSDLLSIPLHTMSVVVSNKDIIGQRLGEITHGTEHGVFVNGINRANVELPVDYDIVLARGDTLSLTGTRDRLKNISAKLGSEETNINETDLLTFSLGIAAGLFIAKITVKVGTLSIGLGMAGGLLLAGIVVGTMSSHNPRFGRIPPAARYLLKELGLLFFMASVGLNTGGGIVEGIISIGPVLFLCGLAVTTIPVLVGCLFGAYILKLNPALLVGAITGSMTSTPALNIVTGAAKSSVPALGYAGTYTFANVFLALAGALIMLFS